MSWKKQKPIVVHAGDSVSQAAAAGATRSELIKVAAHFLLAHTEADRIGVWIEGVHLPRAESRNIAGVRGVVFDRDAATTPSEWEKLSLEAPLPVELLTSGKSVEQDLEALPERPMLGVLVGLQRAIWVPIGMRGHLRGLVLAGLGRKNYANPVGGLQSVTAELALALELCEQQRLAQERAADLATARELLLALADSGPTDAVLKQLVHSCTNSSIRQGGMGASFAVLCAPDDQDGLASREASAHVAAPTSEPRSSTATRSAGSNLLIWQTDGAPWPRALAAESLAPTWRRMRETQGAIWTGPTTGSLRADSHSGSQDSTRTAAIAVNVDNKTCGLLAAGFPLGSPSGALLERLECRAALASVALRLRNSEHLAAATAAQLQVSLQAVAGATVLVDANARVAAISPGVEALFGTNGADSLPADKNLPDAPLSFVEMFRNRDQQTVIDWLQRLREPNSTHQHDAPEVELAAGARVRLRGVFSPCAACAGISLEPLTLQGTAHTAFAEAQLSSVIEWLEEGVVLFDADLRIHALNTRFAQIAGLTPEEAMRITTLNGLIARLSPHAADAEHFAERWREQTRTNDAGVREEIQLLRPVPRVLERAARPITDAAGRRIGRVEVYRDLTAQRVFQSKLLQTEKLAALGQMVTNVAHELSNPLTSILGYAQRLLVSADSSHPDAIQQIFQEAERASTIVRQLLMSARDSGPERRHVDLNEIVSRTLELQRFSLAAENVRVEQHLDPTLPAILGDGPGSCSRY